jgi:hypothetical protein
MVDGEMEVSEVRTMHRSTGCRWVQTTVWINTVSDEGPPLASTSAPR